MHLLLHLYSVFLYLDLGVALKIASSLVWIEHTPQPYAIRNFYRGVTPANLTSGGVANLGNDTTIDVAANAETQGLKQYANHRNIRLIYIICEVAYRIVADRSKGINELKDLEGKNIGSIRGTSAAVFIHNMMSSVGVMDEDYTLIEGNSGAIEAFGIWEPAVELGAQALGPNAVLFKNASIYREVYALYSTTEALSDPRRRSDIVEFVRALNKTINVFDKDAEKADVYGFVAREVGMDVPVVKAVWGDHKWGGRWDNKDLVEFLVDEDAYLAKVDKRQVVPRQDLEKFLDTSVLDEL